MNTLFVAVFLSVATDACYAHLIMLPYVVASVHSGFANDEFSIKLDKKDLTFGQEKCKNCTSYINNSVPYFRNAIQTPNISLVADNVVPVCSKCVMYNFDTPRLYGDACVNPVQNKPGFTDTTFNMIWDNLTMTCECNLNRNIMVDIRKRPNQFRAIGSNCANPERFESDKIFLSTARLIDSLIACGKIYGLVAVTTVNITATLINSKAKYTIRKRTNSTDVNSVSVVEAKVLERSSNDIESTCGGDGDETIVCNCLKESKILAVLMYAYFNEHFNCLLDSNDEEVKSVINSHFVCEGPLSRRKLSLGIRVWGR